MVSRMLQRPLNGKQRANSNRKSAIHGAVNAGVHPTHGPSHKHSKRPAECPARAQSEPTTHRPRPPPYTGTQGRRETDTDIHCLPIQVRTSTTTRRQTPQACLPPVRRNARIMSSQPLSRAPYSQDAGYCATRAGKATPPTDAYLPLTAGANAHPGGANSSYTNSSHAK